MFARTRSTAACRPPHPTGSRSESGPHPNSLLFISLQPSCVCETVKHLNISATSTTTQFSFLSVLVATETVDIGLRTVIGIKLVSNCNTRRVTVLSLIILWSVCLFCCLFSVMYVAATTYYHRQEILLPNGPEKCQNIHWRNNAKTSNINDSKNAHLYAPPIMWH